MYQHLYDQVYLRTHPLTEVLVPEHDLARKERAWRVHQLLLDLIEEIDPGPQAPTFSKAWRRHRLMVLRYEQGLDPQAVADQLAISRRHYYRVHKEAVEAIATILWDRFAADSALLQEERKAAPPSESQELLRSEIARVSQAPRDTSLQEIVEGVSSLLSDRRAQRGLDVEIAFPDGLPHVFVDPALLRQTLLGMVGFLVENAHEALIRLSAQAGESAVRLFIRVEPLSAIQIGEQIDVQRRIAALKEMAEATGVSILTVRADDSVVGFDVRLPTAGRVVLVVDDNEDVLELYQRYLLPHHYDVVVARTGEEALKKARQLQPDAITLDLMMPDQDGWDVLQALLHQPDTQHIPIVVCSVLKQQKELALSLGASAFLKKPVNEQALLSALEAVEE